MRPRNEKPNADSNWPRCDSGESESGTGPVSTKWGIVGDGVNMPRTARVAPGGMVFHILNRGVAHAVVREVGGLPSVRRRPAGNARPIADADLCLLVDAEPLASAALAGARG